MERAANGFLDSEPAILDLVREVGLEQQLVRAVPGARYVYLDGRMRAVPASPPKFLASGLLPWWAKLRMLGDLFASAGPEDESIADFITRRLGRRFLERLVDPMVTGIYAGDVERLSIAACFPKLKALEREHGGLIRGMRARRADPSVSAGPAGRLTSLRGGLATLPLAIASALGGRVRLRARCIGLERIGAGWRALTPGGAQEADAVVMALPANVASPLIEGLDAELEAALEAIAYAPAAVVCLGFDGGRCPPVEGFGCLVPKGTDLGVLGVLFTSSIFPDHAPEGAVLIRTIIGGTRDPRLVSLDDDDLVSIARAANARLLGALPDPRVSRVFRWRLGIPQYEVGHLGRAAVARAAEGRLPGLFVTGNHLDGIGVKDRAREARALVGRIEAYIAG